MRLYLAALNWSEVRVKDVECYTQENGEAVAVVITSGFRVACDVDRGGLFRWAVQMAKRTAESAPSVQLLREGVGEVRAQVGEWPDGVNKQKILNVFEVNDGSAYSL